jgi:hypothetical protein
MKSVNRDMRSPNPRRICSAFFSFVCVLILIVAGLALTQSIIGPTFLNPKVMQEDIRELSSLYRTAPISGAFAYRPPCL